MTLDELRAAIDRLACSGDTEVRASMGDMPLVVDDVHLEPHPHTDLTPPQAVMLAVSPLRP